MIGNQQRNLKHIERIHGETFQAKFPLRVYSKNYFYSGESQFKSSSILAAAFSNAAISLFPPELLFLIWMPQLSTEKH